MNELPEGDCGIGMTQASSSGFILATRVGKHTDQFISELITNTEGKTNCKYWHTDDWGGYERVLPPEVKHIFNWIWVHTRKENTATQRAELAIAPCSWNDHYTYPTLY